METTSGVPMWIADKAVELAPLIAKVKARHPHLKRYQLAKILKNEYGVSYAEDNIVKIINRSAINDTITRPVLDDDDIELPESLYEETPMYEIPAKVQKLLVLSDIHVPFHDPVSLKLALEYGRDHGIDGILLNGDVIDCYSLSRFQRSLKYRNFEVERSRTIDLFEAIQKIFPGIPIFFKAGNHEDRLEAALQYNLPELSETKGLKIHELLELDDHGIEYLTSIQVVKFNGLHILHGHEFNHGGIHVAYNIRIKSVDNVAFGHFHRTQEDTWKGISREVGGWSIGCLCGLRPDWMPINNWNHGFMIVTRRPNNEFAVDNKKIIGRSVL